MHPEWWTTQRVIELVEPPTRESVLATIGGFYTFARCAFTHLLYSQIETTFRAILRALEPGALNGATVSFPRVFKYLCEQCLSRPQGWQSELDLLKFFGIIRNLIHNNGFFVSPSGTDEFVSFGGCEYHFRHRGHADFLHFETIISISDALLPFLEAVVSHPAVVALPPIEDPVLIHP